MYDLSDDDKMEHVLTSSNASKLSESSSSSLVREQSKRGRKISSLEDKGQQGEANVVVVMSIQPL